MNLSFYGRSNQNLPSQQCIKMPNQFRTRRTFGRQIRDKINHSFFQKNQMKKNIHQQNITKNNLSFHMNNPKINDHQEIIDKLQYIQEYKEQILNHLKEKENYFINFSTTYFKKHKQINQQMRTILVDWLIDVHLKFKLMQQTLYLSINILDRYLEANQITVKNLQLAGICSLFIASKYEQIYPPKTHYFTDITNKAYKLNQLIDMQGKIVKSMKFNLVVQTAWNYLQLYNKCIEIDEKEKYLSCYLLQMTLLTVTFLKFKPRILASASLYLSKKILGNQNCWSQNLSRTLNTKIQDIQNCGKQICIFIISQNKSKYDAIKKKYSSKKFCQVSKITIQKNI